MKKKYTCKMHNREGDTWELTWLHSALLHVCEEGGGQCLERLQVSASGVFFNHLYSIFFKYRVSHWILIECADWPMSSNDLISLPPPSPSLGYWCIIPHIFMLMMGIKLSSPCLPQALYSWSHFPSLHFSIKCNKQNFLTLRIISFDFKIRSVCKVKRHYRVEIL